VSRKPESWQAQLVDVTNSLSLKPGKAPDVPAAEFREVSRGTFSLLLRPPKDAERGEVSIHVTRQSDNKGVVVEFSLACRAAGAGCNTV
jgi:hypothetical protein